MVDYTPYYKNKKIFSIRSLSLALGVDEKNLLNISNDTEKYYFKNKPILKSNGSERVTYSVKKRLKFIHERIKTNIFHNVYFPRYLQGAIKSDGIPRDYIYDALIHSKNRFYINEDVANFYPSINYKKVYDLWSCFFGFSKEVSEVLTKLTTYNGEVPQGSKTSSYIGNLIFWRKEGALVEKLEQEGVTYTRFIDDITLSSQEFIPKNKITKIIASIYGMMLAADVRPNRNKHFMGSSKNKVKIHNLNVSGNSVSLGKNKLNSIRLEVYHCKKMACLSGTSGEKYKKQYRIIMSKIGQMGRLHPIKSKKYKSELLKYKPFYFNSSTM